MQCEKMQACVDMTVAGAIEDMAKVEGISISEARDIILESKAYECMCDFETGMWKEGPDYLRDTVRRIAEVKTKS